MKIAGVYSFNNGKEAITRQHRERLDEVLQVIDAIDAESCKIKESKEKTMMGRLIYSPPALNNKFKEQFATRNWVNYKVIAEYSKDYYVPGYIPPARSGREPAPFRDMDFVKNKLGIEVQFGKYSFMVYNVCAKMTIFAKMGVIDCGIEIVPVTAQQERRETIAKHLHDAALQVQELPDGYSFLYPANLFLTVAEFIALEKQCCPFFTFQLTVEHDNGPLEFQITGRDGVKEFIQEEVGLSSERK